MDDDCVFLILEHLEFDDLLSVAQINDELSPLAADVYRRKYSHSRIEVGNYFYYSDKRYELIELLNVTGIKIDTDTLEQILKEESLVVNAKSNIEICDDHIDVNHYDDVLKTFKHFGHVMKKLKCISTSKAPVWQQQLVGYLISKYSSESLIDVEFEGNPDELWQHITKPLNNVENVRYIQNTLEPRIMIISFCDLFPTVHRLHLHGWTHYNLPNFHCHMPHLEHFSMIQSNNGSFYREILRKNPQIQSLNLDNVQSEFVHEINILLPQLETLELSRCRVRSGSIQFENVTTLRLGDAAFVSPENLHFPQLKSLIIDYNYLYFDEYQSFLNEHRHLNRLHMKGYFKDGPQFQQLTANLRDLLEVTLEYPCYVDFFRDLNSNTIVEFLRSHDHVNQLNVIDFSIEWKTKLQEELQHEWSSRIIENGLSFERK